MKRLLIFCTGLAFAMILAADGPAAAPAPIYRKQALATEFYCEGIASGDFNRDGKMDIVAGPFWFEGPDFGRRHEIYPPTVFPPLKYSNNFLAFVRDFNADGWPDVLVIGFPGKEITWYENPRGRDEPWTRHVAFQPVGNESPVFAPFSAAGLPELACVSDRRLGRVRFAPDQSGAQWTFDPISPPGDYGVFMHGLGVGDVNGDGRPDLVEKSGWWEQPAAGVAGSGWTKHPAVFSRGKGGAQMYVSDLNDDGRADVISGHDAHGYGLSWFAQQRGADGQATWKEHVILSAEADGNTEGVQFSQLHAIAVADLDGDGRLDIVTGKRWWAHGPTGDVDAGGAPVIYAFRQERGAGEEIVFRPQRVDDSSGVGTQIALSDVNGDGRVDILTANKRGIFVFLSQKPKL